eukprot:scaffold38126_cov168-Amphora_coffeaeformis.AAC.2
MYVARSRGKVSRDESKLWVVKEERDKEKHPTCHEKVESENKNPLERRMTRDMDAWFWKFKTIASHSVRLACM